MSKAHVHEAHTLSAFYIKVSKDIRLKDERVSPNMPKIGRHVRKYLNLSLTFIWLKKVKTILQDYIQTNKAS